MTSEIKNYTVKRVVIEKSEDITPDVVYIQRTGNYRIEESSVKKFETMYWMTGMFIVGFVAGILLTVLISNT